MDRSRPAPKASSPTPLGVSTMGLMLAGAWLAPNPADAATPASDTPQRAHHRHARHHGQTRAAQHPNGSAPAGTAPAAGTGAGTGAAPANFHPRTPDGRHALEATHHEELDVYGQPTGYQETRPHLDRIMTRLVDTPQSVVEIPHQLMKDQNSVSMLDVLRTVPGISIAAGEGAQQGDNLSIRGFNAQNDFYRDGMLDFGSYYRDPFDLETVEVLKGPSATLFGRGSTGGVINETTKRADLQTRNEASFSAGTDETKRLTVDVSRHYDTLGGTAFRINAMAHDAGVAGVNYAHTSRYGIAPSLAFGLHTDTRLRLDYFRQQSYDNQSYGIPWMNGSPAPVARSSYYGYNNDYLRSAVNIATVRVEHDFGKFLQVHDQFRYSSYNTGQRAVEPQLLGYSPYTDIVPAGIPLSQLNISRNVLALSGPSSLLDNQLQGNGDFTTGIFRNRVVFGFEVQRQTSDITRYNFLPRTTSPLLESNAYAILPYGSSLRSMSGAVSHDYAPYLNDTLNIGKHWELVGGWRWDDYTTNYHEDVARIGVSRNDKVSSWRGALVYKPNDHSSVYFNYGTSFDPSGENIALTAATAAVAPEKSQSFEVGGKWDLRRGLSLTAAAYRIEMSNVRETVGNSSRLAGDQRSQGFELSVSGRITPQWSVFGGYSYDDMTVIKSSNKLEIGNQPQNAPKHTMAVWTEYKLKAIPLEFGAGVNYVSSRTASAAPVSGTTVIERAPGYTTAQIMLKYRINRHIATQVNLTNISDTYYYGALHPTHIVVGPARAALFSITAEY